MIGLHAMSRITPDSLRREVFTTLLDFEAMPGRYPLALREPRVLFDSTHDIMLLAAGRSVEGLAQDPDLDARVRHAARFFVRTAMLRPGVDHYTMLGLAPGFDATALRDHYRLMIRMTHPDFAAAGEAWPSDAATRINLANDVLSSPVRKRDYDQSLPRPRVASSPGVMPRPMRRPVPAERPRPVTGPVGWFAKVPVAGRRSGFPGKRVVVPAAVAAAGVALLAVGWLGDRDEVVVASAPAPAPPMARAPESVPVVASRPGAMPKPVLRAEPAPHSPAKPQPVAPAAPTPPVVVARAPAPQAPARSSHPPVVVERAVAPRLVTAPVPPPAPAVARIPVPVPSRASVPVPALAPFPASALVAAPAPIPAPPAPVPVVAAAVAVTPSPVANVPIAAPQPAPVPVVAAVSSASSAPRVSMAEVQPTLANVIGALQSGRGEDVVQWLDRASRRSEGAASFVQAYNRVLAGSRVVRLGQAQFRSRTAADQLVVDGAIQLHLQDDSQRTIVRDFHLRAYFASRDGGPVLTQLVASGVE